MTVFNFEPQARILLQLGDQLIRNESIALLEIIKNSYDADASKVKILMQNLEDPETGVITIEDDGEGMDKSTVKNGWMKPGSNLKQKKFQNNEVTEKFKRLPIGEKGIGRFGVHKLGYTITIISKKKGKKEIFFKINWKDFEKETTLNRIKISVIEREPKHFIENTGTLIQIKKLRNPWTRSSIRELYRAINSLNSPFESSSSFHVQFRIDNPELISGLLSFKQIKDYALYYADAVIEANNITELKYEFKPWDTMSKIEGETRVFKNIRMVKETKNEETKKNEQVEIDLSNHSIGKIKFKILIFDRDSKILSLGVTDKSGFKKYLDQNGGIRIFRNGIRVYDYGEPTNDWLELDIKRVNRPGVQLSNNIIIGAIDINRESSSDLVEKTNREGFIEDAAYIAFKDSVEFTLDKIITQRNLDKEKIRKFYTGVKVNEPVTGNLRILYSTIKEKIKDHELRDDLLKTVSYAEKEFEELKEIYLRSSNAGLSMGIVIHELEKLVDELIRVVEKYPEKSQIKILINHLSQIISDYSVVIKQSKKKNENLISLIDQALFNVTFRLKAHNVIVSKQYKSRTNFKDVKCSANLIISTIMNFIDNSIWWLNYAKRPKKKIYIDLITEYNGYVGLLFVDNGPGFSISQDDAIRPFISDKPNGMGLGLHFASEIMNAHKGQLLFPEWGDISLPREYKDGAKIVMAFKEN